MNLLILKITKMRKILQFITENWLVVVAIYEALARLVPTKSKFYSIIALINKIIPNVKKNEDKTTSLHK